MDNMPVIEESGSFRGPDLAMEHRIVERLEQSLLNAS